MTAPASLSPPLSAPDGRPCQPPEQIDRRAGLHGANLLNETPIDTIGQATADGTPWFTIACRRKENCLAAKAKQDRQQRLPVLPARRRKPDGLDARLPFRWPQDETGKTVRIS